MRLFEKFCIVRGEGDGRQYLRRGRCFFIPVWTKEVEDAWLSEDLRIAYMVAEDFVPPEKFEVRVVSRWWWFGWHEEVVGK